MRYLENALALVGLIAVILGCALFLLNLERASLPDCDIKIKGSGGESCYQIRERK